MAQIVGFWEDFATPEREAEAYSEGPFVLVDAHGYRIEAELKGHKCPVALDASILPLKESLGWGIGKTNDLAMATRVCDELNQMVRDGRIVNQHGVWIAAN